MDLIKQTREAFQKAIDRSDGKLIRLQEKTGVDYSIINRLNSGKRSFKDVPLRTFERLFPEMLVHFFKDEYPRMVSEKADLTTAERKIIKIMRELDEDEQLDLLMEAAAIRERRSKKEPQRKIPKAG